MTTSLLQACNTEEGMRLSPALPTIFLMSRRLGSREKSLQVGVNTPCGCSSQGILYSYSSPHLTSTSLLKIIAEYFLPHCMAPSISSFHGLPLVKGACVPSLLRGGWDSVHFKILGFWKIQLFDVFSKVVIFKVYMGFPCCWGRNATSSRSLYPWKSKTTDIPQYFILP